jgi:NADH-quinone oxidoreductase subunit G
MITDDWNGFNVLQSTAGRVGGLDIGFVPGTGGLDYAGILNGASNGSVDTVFLLAADDFNNRHLDKAFVVYQGHHGDHGAHVADVILPGAAYSEKEATYVNTEGRVQLSARAVFAPGDAREDWTIIRALSDVLGKSLAYNNVAELRTRMTEINPVFGTYDTVTPSKYSKAGHKGDLVDLIFSSCIDNYYMSDPISRASATMAECTDVYVTNAQGKTGTNG